MPASSQSQETYHFMPTKVMPDVAITAVLKLTKKEVMYQELTYYDSTNYALFGGVWIGALY